MDPSEPTSLVVPLPLPPRGSASRVRIGGAELVLEHARGAHSLLWSDGRQSRRYVLGLMPRGELRVELRSPRHPVQLVLRETMTLVPGARLSGYVTVPLVPTIVWRDGRGVAEQLFDLHPRDLQASWDEREGHVLRCATTWLSRFPFRRGEPCVVVPLRLRNPAGRAACPAHLAVRLDDEDLAQLRGTVVVRPRRLVLRGDEAVPAGAPELTMEQA